MNIIIRLNILSEIVYDHFAKKVSPKIIIPIEEYDN